MKEDSEHTCYYSEEFGTKTYMPLFGRVEEVLEHTFYIYWQIYNLISMKSHKSVYKKDRRIDLEYKNVVNHSSLLIHTTIFILPF